MCCCSGMKTRSKVQEYANICPDCKKKLRSDRDLAKYKELREVLVVSKGLDEEEPIYEAPVDKAEVVGEEIEGVLQEGNTMDKQGSLGIPKRDTKRTLGIPRDSKRIQKGTLRNPRHSKKGQ